MSWQREYKSIRSTTVAIFFGAVWGFMGLVFMFVFSPLAGGALLLGGIIVALLITYFATNVDVYCNEHGFRVITESKRQGKNDVTYAWNEVTATRYFERVTRSSKGSRTKAYFAVDTARGTAFQVDYQIRNFRDLIEVFNVMTVQIPYVWKPRTGFTISFGPLTASKWAYVQVDREQAAQQQ